MRFYQDLSSIYDDMIRFNQRIKNEKQVFRELLNKYPARFALDAGCGSGYHSILLSQLNLRMTGFDSSEEMLNLARENAIRYRVNPSLYIGNFTVKNTSFQNSFDAVFCLGNSFVHLLTHDDRTATLMNFKDYLQANGYLCIQIVNYDKILNDRQELLAVREVNNQVITRTYSFNQTTITFNVKVESKNNSTEYSTELYPLRSEELITLFKTTGFDKINIFGDLKFSPYKKYLSDNICIIGYSNT